MPRANRYFVPGQLYHLTHRCHNREFLLKFARDRDAYRLKLRENIHRFDLALLDYSITCNHVHLLLSAADSEQISRFMQRVEGEFAQAYNSRKQRRGAYWEDRFHSTMIQPDGHLEECLVYIALNMVRCRAVPHPREWRWCGYQEFMGLRQRFRILDIDYVLALFRVTSIEDFRRHYDALIAERIAQGNLKREPKWTESIAVGSEDYVRQVADQIKGRQQLEITGQGNSWILRDASTSYADFSGMEFACNDRSDR